MLPLHPTGNVQKNLADSDNFKEVITTLLTTRSSRREVWSLTRQVQALDAQLNEVYQSKPAENHEDQGLKGILYDMIEECNGFLPKRFATLCDLLNGKKITFRGTRKAHFHNMLELKSPYPRKRRVIGSGLPELRDVERAVLKSIEKYIEGTTNQINWASKLRADQEVSYSGMNIFRYATPEVDQIEYGLGTNIDYAKYIPTSKPAWDNIEFVPRAKVDLQVFTHMFEKTEKTHNNGNKTNSRILLCIPVVFFGGLIIRYSFESRWTISFEKTLVFEAGAFLILIFACYRWYLYRHAIQKHAFREVDEESANFYHNN
ncbi:hypothetical protein BDZ45DRAFT_690919 [Acephala macrosclerotiorum]|nr:hypothetical protein BDZ45DRAFT_690919 [Acephala macrosclerotiorum]